MHFLFNKNCPNIKPHAGKLLLLIFIVFATFIAGAQNINTPNKMGPLGTEVNTFTGNLFIPRNDIFIPARGFNISIEFNYNSFNFDKNIGFGNGWNIKYGIKYKNDTANSETIVWGDEREDNYTVSGGGYKSPKGFFNTLSQYQPGKYLLVETNGTRYYFDNSIHKKITRLEEPNGNYINFNYTDSLLTAITNTAGQTINLTYDGSGRLISVIDGIVAPTRTYTYTYDANNNLTQVTDPLGGTYKYSYLVNGPMKTVTDKNNNTVDIIYYNDYSISEIIGCNKRVSFSYDTTSHTTMVTDYLTTGNNQVTKYTYNRFDNIVWLSSLTSNCCGFNLSFEYDANGNKIKETDANGNVYNYTYDSRGNLLTIKDPLNQTETYTYTTDFNNISSYTDAKGNKLTMNYDANGNLTQLIEPGNQIYSATYNTNGDIVSTTDAKGYLYSLAYDAYGNTSSITGPNGEHAIISNDARGKLLSYTNARGMVDSLQYDILNRVKKITDPVNNAFQFNYDAAGNTTSVINKNNETSILNYDASNRLVKFTNPIGYNINFSYDGMDNLVEVKNQLGNAVDLKYDTRNRLSSIIDPLGNSSTYSYDANGNITSQILPSGERMTYTYDNLNRITTFNDITGTIGTLTYDKNDNVTSYTNGTGATATASYDSLNRVIKIADPLSLPTTFTYDKNGNVNSVTDMNGFAKYFTYDSLNRVLSYTDNNGLITTVVYDAAGNVIQAKDQKNNITLFSYDSLNRLKITTYPDGNFMQNNYDKKGNIVSRRLTDGSTIAYQYDTLNRLKTKSLPDGNVYTYGYDGLNRVISAGNNSGVVTITYDALNRISSESFDGRTTRYTYNIASRTQTTTYPDSTVITKSYDYRNRLTSIAKNNTTIVSYQYNNANQVTVKNFANGVTSNMQYDFANRLSNISTAGGSIQNTSFTYDNERNRTSINRQNTPSLSEQFTYDNKYRLTNYKRGTPGGTPTIQNNYNYDAVGNRTSANLNGTTTNYASNNLNQLTNSNNGNQNINFAYDNNGNLTFDGNFHKFYDAEGRLLKDSSVSNLFIYKYDAFGRRVQKNFNAVSYKYTYSGLSQIEERDGSTNNLLGRTVFTNFLNPVMNDKNNNSFYYHQNELNSVEAITNSSGNLIERYQYDVFGKPTIYDAGNNIISSSIAGNRFAYTGQEYDLNDSSYHFPLRNYSPSTGTFNQRDPLGYSDEMGLYQYVGNNPGTYVDPLGLHEGSPCPGKEGSEEEASLTHELLEWLHHSTHLIEMLTEARLEDVNERVEALAKALIGETDIWNRIRNLSPGKLQQILGEVRLNNANATSAAEGLIKRGGNLRLGGEILGVLGNIANGVDIAAKGYSVGSSMEKNGVASVETYNASIDLGRGFANLNPAGAVFNIGDWVVGKGMNAMTGEESKGAYDFLVSNMQTYYRNKAAGDAEYELFKHYEELDKNGVITYDKEGHITTWLSKYFEILDKAKERDEAKHNPCPPNEHHDGTQHEKPKGPGLPGQSEGIGANDPNEIIGPDGVPSKHWVSVHDRLPYTILYENSTAASAPAKFVRITSPIEPKQDAGSFQLGSFGFNNQTFTVPPNTASYYDRLNCVDSLGLYVDITAGYDQVNNQIFWEFQSIDPVTLLPPSNPLKGFLLQQDSVHQNFGHAFVNFSMKPITTAATLDTIGARASIVFDTNDTIPTNVATNTIDAFPPTSHMVALPGTSSNPVHLAWTGTDDPGGSGIKYYTLYASTDGVNFTIIRSGITRTDTTITLAPNQNFCFFVLATDSVGNMEVFRQGELRCTFVGAGPLPVTWLYFNGTNQDKTNTLDWATGTEINTREFRLERSLDARNFTGIATVAAAGNSTNNRSYQYKDLNIDQLNSPVMYYRLKQINLDGNTNYSNVVRLTYNQKAIVNSLVYPNPTQGVITLVIGDKGLIGTNAMLFDENGRLLETIKITATSQSIQMGKYLNGVYFIRLSNKEAIRIIKQ